MRSALLFGLLSPVLSASAVTALAMCSVAQAQEAVAPGAVQPDGSVAGVPTVVPGKEVDFIAATFQSARAAASEKRWGLFVSILLMALLAGFNALLIRSQELRDRVKAYMGEIAVVMALAGYIGIAVASLPVGAHVGDWWAVIWPALKTGFAAIGAYEILVKRVLGVYLPKLGAWIVGKFSKTPEAPKP